MIYFILSLYGNHFIMSIWPVKSFTNIWLPSFGLTRYKSLERTGRRLHICCWLWDACVELSLASLFVLCHPLICCHLTTCLTNDDATTQNSCLIIAPHSCQFLHVLLVYIKFENVYKIVWIITIIIFSINYLFFMCFHMIQDYI